MAIRYHVYTNDGAGGPIDYSTPVADVSGTSWVIPPAPTSETHAAFGVRAYDDASGLEERNVDVVVRLDIDDLGDPIPATPAAPGYVRAEPAGVGELAVTWLLPAHGPRPTSCRVYGGTPTVSYGAPLATVDPGPAPAATARLTGLTPGATYQVAVRLVGAGGEGPPSAVASAVVRAAALSAPAYLGAEAVPGA
jgi:hypothetical protein